jgi:hypothetical protein
MTSAYISVTAELGEDVRGWSPAVGPSRSSWVAWLKREVVKLTADRDIQKYAAGYFAREST